MTQGNNFNYIKKQTTNLIQRNETKKHLLRYLLQGISHRNIIQLQIKIKIDNTPQEIGIDRMVPTRFQVKVSY